MSSSKVLKTPSDTPPRKTAPSRVAKKIEDLTPADLSTRIRPKSPVKQDEITEKIIIPTSYRGNAASLTSFSNSASPRDTPAHDQIKEQVDESSSSTHHQSKSTNRDDYDHGHKIEKTSEKDSDKAGNNEEETSLLQKVKSHQNPLIVNHQQSAIMREAVSVHRNTLSPKSLEQENNASLKLMSASSPRSTPNRQFSLKKSNITQYLRQTQNMAAELKAPISPSNPNQKDSRPFKKSNISDSLKPIKLWSAPEDQRISPENSDRHLKSLSNQGSPSNTISGSFRKSKIAENNKIPLGEESFTTSSLSGSRSSIGDQPTKARAPQDLSKLSHESSFNSRAIKSQKEEKEVSGASWSSDSPNEIRKDQMTLKKKELLEHLKKQQQQTLPLAVDQASGLISDNRETKNATRDSFTNPTTADRQNTTWRLSAESRRLWVQITCNMKMSCRLIKRAQSCQHWGDNIVKIPLKDDGSMAFIMKMYISEGDANLTRKMETLLSRNSTRTRDAINELDQILKFRLPSYASFPLDKRMKLCRIMQFESYPQGKLVCKEGQRAENFYFILSGKMEIFLTKYKENFRSRVNVMNPGESIGRIQLVNDIRMASIATLQPTELLCINKREFASAQHQVVSAEELEEQMQALRVLNHFSNNDTFLKNSKGCFDITVYSNGDVVMQEGDISDRIYFILRGTCKCTKTVTFVRNKKNLIRERDISIYVPGQVLHPNEELVRYTLDIQELESSDHFPGIPPESNKIKEILTVDSDKASSMLRGFFGENEDDHSCAHFSVVATGRCEIASISKIDYITHASKEMLSETLLQKNLYSVSEREVQLAFLDQQAWKSYKQSIVSNY